MNENKNDIIDVEVEEEIIETLPSEPFEAPEDNKPSYSDEEIDEKVKELQEELKTNDFKATSKVEQLANEVASNSKDYLDSNTYLWVMYAYAMKYKKAENKNAERFCYLRMVSVLDAISGKRKKHRALTFEELNITDNMKNDVAENTAFMKKASASLRNQFLLMELVMLVLFVGLMVFIFHYTLITTLGFCALLLFANYMMTYRSLFDRYYKEQTEASKSHCKDQELIDFDLPIYLS